MENKEEKKLWQHTVCRTKKPDSYPDRFHVPDEKVSWQESYPEYNPPYFVHEKVLANAGVNEKEGKADCEDINISKKKSYGYSQVAPHVHFDPDHNGNPLNPWGRTGIAGRGLLYKWGANQAVDIVLLTIHPKTRLLSFLAVKRVDNGMNAIVGGMVDDGESRKKAVLRELGEEVPQFEDFDEGLVQNVDLLYSDDYRNTDNAWIETNIFTAFLTPDKFIDEFYDFDPTEIESVSWLPVQRDMVLHASHSMQVYSVVRYYMSKYDVPESVESQCAFLFE